MIKLTGNQTSKELILLNHWHRKKIVRKRKQKHLHTSKKTHKKGNTETAYKMNTKPFVLSPNCKNL